MNGDVRTAESVLANVCLLPDEWRRPAQSTWALLYASPVKNRALQVFLYQPIFLYLFSKYVLELVFRLVLLLHCSSYSLNQMYLYPFKHKRRQKF